jgi:hypothetical protein
MIESNCLAGPPLLQSEGGRGGRSSKGTGRGQRIGARVEAPLGEGKAKGRTNWAFEGQIDQDLTVIWQQSDYQVCGSAQVHIW